MPVFEVMLMLSWVSPLSVGVNVKERTQVAPGATVALAVQVVPVESSVNVGPETMTLPMVRVALPVLETRTVEVTGLPTVAETCWLPTPLRTPRTSGLNPILPRIGKCNGIWF